MASYGVAAALTGLAVSLAGCASGGATTEAPMSTTEAPVLPGAIQPHTIQLREHPGRCVEIVDESASNGSPIHFAECQEQAIHQSWLFDVNSSVIRSAVDISKCLDITNAYVEKGTLLQIWDCYFGEGQFWGYDDGPGIIYHFRAMDKFTIAGKFCLDLPEDVIGSQIEIWNCDDKPAQSWSLGPSSFPPVPIPSPPGPPEPSTTDAPGPLESSTTEAPVSGTIIRYRNDVDKCLDTSSTSLSVRHCDDSGSREQAFAIDEAGAAIKSAVDASLCLTASSFSDGAALSLELCSGLDGQSWAYDDGPGRIYSCPDGDCDSAWCVNLEKRSSQVFVSSCDGMQLQEWTTESIGLVVAV